MSASEMPVWMACGIGGLALIGSGLTFLGCTGVVRFKTFFERVQATTLGSTVGMALICVASILLFWKLEGKLIPRELLIVLFITFTTPVTMLLLARAALFRDRTEALEGPQEAVDDGEALVAKKHTAPDAEKS